MSIYSITYSNIWKSLNPPILRKEVNNAWGIALLKPLQELRDLVFDDYANGSAYEVFNIYSAYSAGDRVIYIDRAVYQNISGSTSGYTPTNTNYWNKINDNYIGARERVKYNSQKILFEYALNRWFQTTGIYITNTPLYNTGLLMGQTGENSSALSTTLFAAGSYLISNFSGINTSCFTINVPNNTLTGLSSDYSERIKIVRSIADEYTIAGMDYSVSGY